MLEKNDRQSGLMDKFWQPFHHFFHTEAAGGVVLIVCAVAALIWANSPWRSVYDALWQTRFTVGLHDWSLSKPLLLWINDGLMAVFFFVVGLEIKREILVGELASFKRAALPIVAAVGGMVVPALLFAVFNYNRAGASGWGIPMATDIAFALGILSLLGKRAPLSIKIFLTALAIVDDLGAVLVIALFYTAKLSLPALAAAGVIFVLLIAANRLDARSPYIYGILAIAMWVAFLKSGIHATIAGVLAAMTIPARTKIDAGAFLKKSRVCIDQFGRTGETGPNMLTNKKQHGILQALETTCQQAESPLQRFEHTLHPWVAFVIMPVFALANAGVPIGAGFGRALLNPLSLGIIAGLVIGKQLGIMTALWLTVKTGVAGISTDTTWRHLYGASCLAGIGFTMSLFIAGLAFRDPQLLDVAKTGILCASLASGFLGWWVLKGAASGES